MAVLTGRSSIDVEKSQLQDRETRNSEVAATSEASSARWNWWIRTLFPSSELVALCGTSHGDGIWSHSNRPSQWSQAVNMQLSCGRFYIWMCSYSCVSPAKHQMMFLLSQGVHQKKTCFVIKVPKKSVIISKMPPAATWLMVSASNLSIGSSAHLIHLEWNIKYEKIWAMVLTIWFMVIPSIFFRIPYKMVIIKIPLNHHWMTSPY